MDVKRQHQRRASSINGWQLRRGIEPGTLWLARSDVDDDDDAIYSSVQSIDWKRSPSLPARAGLAFGAASRSSTLIQDDDAYDDDDDDDRKWMER